MASADMAESLASSSKGAAASAAALSAASTPSTRRAASRVKALVFLAAELVFSSPSRFAATSSCFWSSFNFSVASLARVSWKRFASTNFVARNIRAMEAAVFAAVAAVSQAFTAPRASSSGKSSTPMRKGASASAALEMVPCTCCIFSAASARSEAQRDFSLASLCWLFSCARRVCEPLARSSSFASSSRGMPCEAVAFFCAMNLSTEAT
mmetsp:Transcript_59215/g.171665  ORF Transcript_59215/g.171665 Transcript_59215/m.171665 type:complete len:210 (+) Transcript_59215:337-966(+)